MKKETEELGSRSRIVTLNEEQGSGLTAAILDRSYAQWIGELKRRLEVTDCDFDDRIEPRAAEDNA